MEGRVQGNFYAKAWPQFTTVVFQCVEPRLSETADLMCYSTSKHDLLHVLQQNQLVTEGKWQMIPIVEDDSKTIGEYVIKNIKINGQSLSSQHYFALHTDIYSFLGQVNLLNAPCPEGYFLGTLMEEHDHFAASQGDWFYNFRRPADVAKEFHKQCVQRFGAIAAYHNQDPTTPVAWNIQWSNNGNIGNVFTVEEHRRKGLAVATLVEACSRILAKEDLPECHIEEDNTSSVNLFTKLGFSSIGKAVDLVPHF